MGTLIQVLMAFKSMKVHRLGQPSYRLWYDVAVQV
jgi:hypothetical protein